MNNLRDIRKANGLTIEEVAKRVGVTRQYISSIELGRYEPTVKVARKIGAVLGIDWVSIYNK